MTSVAHELYPTFLISSKTSHHSVCASIELATSAERRSMSSCSNFFTPSTATSNADSLSTPLRFYVSVGHQIPWIQVLSGLLDHAAQDSGHINQQLLSVLLVRDMTRRIGVQSPSKAFFKKIILSDSCFRYGHRMRPRLRPVDQINSEGIFHPIALLDVNRTGNFRHYS